MPNFELQSNVAANVRALRKALGSVTKELSRDDLAAMIGQRHPGKRRPNGTSVQRWEESVEPDYHSARIMADLAGVTFEQFAFGDMGALVAPNPELDRRLTREEEERAKRAAERTRRERAAGARGKRRGGDKG